MDKGESVAECLQREIKDETNLKVQIGDILAIREYPKGHEMFNKIKALRFIAYYQGGEVKLSEEHSSFQWLTFAEVEKKLADDGYEQEKKETILLARKYLQNHNSVEKWQRSIADFENYKRQTAKQNKEFKKYATENVIVDILPVLDNFQASLEHIPEEEREGGWVTGILYIQKQLLDVLQNHGVQPLETKAGDKFDANFHEAIKAGEKEKAPVKRPKKKTAETKSKDLITKVIKDGYKIGEKIIRPALVEVEQ
jgi:molecular chaperone GrpE